MELNEAILKRRSIRKYSKDPVPREAVDRILQAAYLAPSGANASPWLYVVVSDGDVKRRIREASEAVDGSWNSEQPDWFRSWLAAQGITREKAFLEDAPYLLVVFSDTRIPYALESTWISIGFAALAATQEGLGTLTYTPGDPSFLTEILGVPSQYTPQAILPLGYADEAPDSALRAKRPRSRDTAYDR